MVNENPNQPLLRSIARFILRLLTRTTITGLENVPAKGPLMILANHASTIDSMLLMAFVPTENIYFVGPGDFKLLFPANYILKWYGMIPVKRSSQLERNSLKQMSEVLKRGDTLSLFPEGGTWEKPIWEAKGGAAYVSQSTQSPILPVGLGGTYRVWYDIVKFKRPKITVNIGKVMAPVAVPSDKSKREESLTDGTHEIMKQIYALLPAADQARYHDLEVRKYDLLVEVKRGDQFETIQLLGKEILGEIMVKPNLMSPLMNNAGLPLDPFKMHSYEFPVQAMQLSVKVFQEALKGNFGEYFEYRLGETKTAHLRSALDALADIVSSEGVTSVKLTPTSHID